jgi:hypothetical protein
MYSKKTMLLSYLSSQYHTIKGYIMKTITSNIIITKTEEYLIKKENISINGYLTTFILNDIKYAMIHFGGNNKIDKYLIRGSISEKILLTEVLTYAYFWGTYLWNDTYLSSDGNLQMIILRHNKNVIISQKS